MKKWNDVKDRISNLSDYEKRTIDLVAELVSEIVIQRQKLGLSQRDLASISGVKQSAIARLEGMVVIPRIDTLLKLLLPLGLTIKVCIKEC